MAIAKTASTTMENITCLELFISLLLPYLLIIDPLAVRAILLLRKHLDVLHVIHVDFNDLQTIVAADHLPAVVLLRHTDVDGFSAAFA